MERHPPFEHLLVALALLAAPAGAEVWRVPSAVASIQAALDAASDGDVVEVGEGVYVEDVDFRGKAVRVVGAGADTVIQGTGTGPVVTFASGEGPDSILDSVLVTGGRAEDGGGIRIDGASPIVVRSFVVGNAARRAGSGISVVGPAAPRLYNDVIGWNERIGDGDPHSLEVRDAAPVIVNATIVRGDSNGVILRGASPARLVASVIARNGSVAGGDARGRGICDFSGETATIRFNVFHRNRVAALLRDGRDWRRVARFQRSRPEATLVAGNRDGAPRFRGGIPRRFSGLELPALLLREARGTAADAGDPDPRCADGDGSRQDVGHTGGPYAVPSSAIPGPESCGSP